MITWYHIKINIEPVKPTNREIFELDTLEMSDSVPTVWTIQFDAPVHLLWFFKRMLHLFRQFIRKNADYAENLVSWYEGFKKGGLRGMYNRIGDKMKRIKNHLRGQKLHNESFSDSCGDAATYLLMLDEAANDPQMTFEGTNWS